MRGYQNPVQVIQHLLSDSLDSGNNVLDNNSSRLMDHLIFCLKETLKFIIFSPLIWIHAKLGNDVIEWNYFSHCFSILQERFRVLKCNRSYSLNKRHDKLLAYYGLKALIHINNLEHFLFQSENIQI